MRRTDPNAAEMKRLYVRLSRFGLGAALGRKNFDVARLAGYASVPLDTLDDMKAARALYAELGFEEFRPITTARLKAAIT